MSCAILQPEILEREESGFNYFYLMEDGVQQSHSPQELDLTGVECPINFAKIMVRLSKMKIGEKLRLAMDDEESVRSVCNSLDMEGQRLISVDELTSEQYVLVVEKTR